MREDGGGYLSVCLWKASKGHMRRVHQLVLETFVGPRPKGMECRHLDGNKHNNHLKNLKWGTRSENQHDAVKHGTHSNGRLGKFGEKHPNSKLSDEDRRLIFGFYNAGICTQRQLGGWFEMSVSQINCIVNDSRWAEKARRKELEKD